MNYPKILTKDIQETDLLDEIFDKYANGDKTVYEIFDGDKSTGCLLTPYDKIIKLNSL